MTNQQIKTFTSALSLLLKKEGLREEFVTEFKNYRTMSWYQYIRLVDVRNIFILAIRNSTQREDKWRRFSRRWDKYVESKLKSDE